MKMFKLDGRLIVNIVVSLFVAFTIWDAGLKSLVDQLLAKVKG